MSNDRKTQLTDIFDDITDEQIEQLEDWVDDTLKERFEFYGTQEEEGFEPLDDRPASQFNVLTNPYMESLLDWQKKFESLRMHVSRTLLPMLDVAIQFGLVEADVVRRIADHAENRVEENPEWWKKPSNPLESYTSSINVDSDEIERSYSHPDEEEEKDN